MSKSLRVEIVLLIIIWCFATAMVTMAHVRNNYVSKQELVETGMFILDTKTNKLIVTPKEVPKP